MARRRGRAKRGQRCRSPIPHGHWKTTTFTGALRLEGMTAPMVLDGPMTSVAFLAYVEQVLVPSLHRGDVVIMDNLPAHRRPAVRAAIEAAGARLLYRPPYSPDFNPVRGTAPNGRLRQTQSHPPQGRRADHQRALAGHPRRPATVHPRRVPKLLHRRRL
jgi:hypothetical protein